MSLILNRTVSSSSGGVTTLTGNSGGAISPSGGNINIVGTGVVNVAGSGSTLTISSSSVAGSYVTDSGTATPAGGILNVLGNHGLNTSGATDTVTIAIDNTIVLGDLSPVASGSDCLTLTTGDLTISSGNLNLPTTADSNNGVIEVNSARFIHSYGTNNSFFGSGAGNFTLTGVSATGIGANALAALTDGGSNTAIGMNSSMSINGGDRNVSLGAASLEFVTTGTDNIALGYSAGSSYALTDSNNISIGNIGLATENATIRIGTNGSQTATYIAGIDGVNVGSVAKVLTMASDKIGTAIITAGTGITVTPGANTITILTNGTTNLTYTGTSTTPYVVLTTDDFISIDCSGGIKTVQLPNAATLGQVFYIKDRTGSAATNNITVTTVGGAVNIDGAVTFVMNSAYQSIAVIGNGSTYEIF